MRIGNRANGEDGLSEDDRVALGRGPARVDRHPRTGALPQRRPPFQRHFRTLHRRIVPHYEGPSGNNLSLGR